MSVRVGVAWDVDEQSRSRGREVDRCREALRCESTPHSHSSSSSSSSSNQYSTVHSAVHVQYMYSTVQYMYCTAPVHLSPHLTTRVVASLSSTPHSITSVGPLLSCLAAKPAPASALSCLVTRGVR